MLELRVRDTKDGFSFQDGMGFQCGDQFTIIGDMQDARRIKNDGLIFGLPARPLSELRDPYWQQRAVALEWFEVNDRETWSDVRDSDDREDSSVASVEGPQVQESSEDEDDSPTGCPIPLMKVTYR